MKLVAAVPLDDGQRERLRAIAPGIDVVAARAFDADDVAGLMGEDTNILYSFRAPLDALDIAPGLQWIQLMSAGCDRLLGSSLLESHVRVTTCSGIAATPIAEHSNETRRSAF